MKKKGFTLIELLAVIVILAIIALIAIPQILGVIERARKGAAEDSAYGYIDAVEKQIALDIINDKEDKSNKVIQVKTYEVNMKGSKPSDGWIKLQKGKVINYSLKINEYYINPVNGKLVADKNGSLQENPNADYTITYVAAGETSNPTIYNADTETFTLTNPTTTKNYCVFTGWSGTDLIGDTNTTVTIPKGSIGDREYTANWTNNKSDFTGYVGGAKGDNCAPTVTAHYTNGILDECWYDGWTCEPGNISFDVTRAAPIDESYCTRSGYGAYNAAGYMITSYYGGLSSYTCP